MNHVNRQLAALAFCSVSFDSHAFMRLTEQQQLGQLLYNDKNLSLNRNQSCATCHSLKPLAADNSIKGIVAATIDPLNSKTGSAVSLGSVKGKKGVLNAPMTAYAMHAPTFYWNKDEELYRGGQFWNGRASDLTAQAQGPFLNPNEMAMPNAWAVVSRLKENPVYQRQFLKLYAVDLATVPTVQTNALAPAIVDDIYHNLASAIAQFEQSALFNKFNSKFDYALFGQTQLTALEKQGLALFKGKALCSACHTIDIEVDHKGQFKPPLFTDYSYDNIGLPQNINIHAPIDLGLGGRDDIDKPSAELGKHKVMTLRNIALTAPYGHNGVLKTLQEIVHFYNTRDNLKRVANNNHPEFGKMAWAAPEVTENVNTSELGDLKLTEAEEHAIVAFLKTLTDDYPLWGHDPNVPVGTPSPFTATH